MIKEALDRARAREQEEAGQKGAHGPHASFPRRAPAGWARNMAEIRQMTAEDPALVDTTLLEKEAADLPCEVGRGLP